MMAAIGLFLIVCILIFLVWPVMRPVQNGYVYFTSGRASGQELKDERDIILAEGSSSSFELNSHGRKYAYG